jgi:RNA polymerase sigma-70 factor (ECF subfamily)
MEKAPPVIHRATGTERPPLRLLPGGSEAAAPAPTDEELIEAVQRGDHRVAGLLYDRLVGVVDHTLFRVFGRREADHDDLVQSVFEQIIVTLSRRSYARACSLKTWASSIASHVGFNALRSRRRERRVLDRDASIDNASVPTRVDTEGTAQARVELDRVRRQLVSMRPEQSQTVFLHDVLGHELAEIALMMRVSVAAAQSRLVRGRRELYRRLDVVSASPPRRRGGSL